MRTGTKQTIRQGLAIALAAISCALPSQSAFAGASYQNSFCDSFCDRLVDPSNGKVLGLNGQDGWTTADDEACAEYNSEYGIGNNGASPSPSPVVSASPVPLPSTQTQDFQCQWHAGQALNYCEAYILPQADNSNNFEMILSVLDSVAAGACWAACVDPEMGATVAACAYAAPVASSTELIENLTMSNSPLATALGSTLSAVGIAGGLASIGKLGSNYLGSKALSGLAKHNPLSQRKTDCITAGVMTVLAAMRIVDMGKQNKTQQDACNSVQSLYSSAPTIAAGATVAGAGSTGGTSLPAPGAMEASGPLNDGRQSLSAGCASKGLGAGGCGFSPAQLSAPDAKILSSGLGQAIAAQAAQQQDAMLGALNSGGPSALGQHLAAGAPNADIAKAISTLAAEAAKDPGSLGASGASAAGGGAGGGSSNQGSTWNFGAQDTAPIAGPAVKSFAGASQVQAPSGDIFHTGFKGSIFDIVSQRMSAVRSQVDQLPWSTPLNRALAGSDEVPAPAPQGANR